MCGRIRCQPTSSTFEIDGEISIQFLDDHELSRPVVIGLSGGVACGKSTVARMFEKLGAVVLDADRIGHEVLDEEEVKLKLRDIWGQELFSDGRVNRRRLAEIVFHPVTGHQHLAVLERITHPRIKAKILKELDTLEAAVCSAVVLDAPLLFKAGWDKLCEKLVFVDVDSEVRFRRARARGWSEREFRERENRQMSLDHKRLNSTDVIHNSNGLVETFSQVKKLWESWGFKVPVELPDIS